MVILHTETLKRWGGQQNRVLSEAIGLNQRGHHVIIVCHRGSALAEKSKKAGIKVYEVNMVKQAHVKTIPELIHIIRKEKIDIVSTHSSVDSWAGGIASRLTGRHLVRFRHNLFPIGRDPLTRLIYSMPDSIITISNAVKNVLVNRGIKKKKITVIPSSVNTEFFNPEVDDLRKELKIPPDAIVIGNTSTFTQLKGQEFLLQAFNMIYEKIPCILLFAGDLDEPFKTEYLSHVNEGLRDKVIFLDHREDIPRVLKIIDIFVYPSLLEGLGTALIEAMAMEKPIILSNIPTFRDFIEDRVNGLYFNVRDSEDLAVKVISLIQNKNLREQLSRNARVTALEQFTHEKMIDLTEAHYKEILHAL